MRVQRVNMRLVRRDDAARIRVLYARLRRDALRCDVRSDALLTLLGHGGSFLLF